MVDRDRVEGSGGPRHRSARDAVADHARGLTVDRRRELGSHATPEALALHLVELALRHLHRLPQRVLDPSCGAGSFLLAAADALVRRGADPAEVVEQRLEGWDLDPEAVAHCREALRRWAAAHGVRRPVDVRVIETDALGPTAGPPGSLARTLSPRTSTTRPSKPPARSRASARGTLLSNESRVEDARRARCRASRSARSTTSTCPGAGMGRK